MLRPLLAVLLLGYCCGASAQRAWVCSYPGTNPKESVVLNYVKAGDYMVEDHFGLRYRILQDSKYALVAAWSIAEMEPNSQEPSIGVFTIMIDKISKRYRRAVASLHDADDRTDVGKCEARAPSK